VRTLLGYFDAQRRGAYVVQRIRDALDELGIETRPDFADLWIDDEIELIPKATPTTGDPKSTNGHWPAPGSVDSILS